MTQGELSSVIILAIFLILIQVLFGNVIEPKFAGKKLALHPIIIIVSLVFWGSIWGVGGMLFSVPLTLFVKFLYNLSHIIDK